MTTNCALCKAVVIRLIQRHQWQLLTADELTRRLHLRVVETNGSHAEHALISLVTNLYCIEVYEACGSEGERQERAFLELSCRLYNRAIYKYKDADLAQELVQEAIFRVFRLLDTCKNPGAFFAFANLKLWQAATDYFRKRDRDQQRIDALPDEDEDDSSDTSIDQLIDSDLPSPEEFTMESEMAEGLLNEIAKMIQQNPRAQNQLLAVILKYLSGWSDEEIARKLKTSVSNVHVLRTRGLKRLRDDPSFGKLWEQL